MKNNNDDNMGFTLEDNLDKMYKNDALNHWNKKIYLVLTGIPEKSKLELYVNKEDKAEFIKLANEKMQGYNM